MSFAGTYINSGNDKAGLIVEGADPSPVVKVITDTSGSGTYKIRCQGSLAKEKDAYRTEMDTCDGRKLILEIVPSGEELTVSFSYFSDLDGDSLPSVEQYQYKKVPDNSLKT